MLWSFYYAAEGEKLCGTSIALRKALCATEFWGVKTPYTLAWILSILVASWTILTLEEEFVDLRRQGKFGP